MGVWIDNPHTIPKPEAFRELIDQLVKDNGVSPSNSPGKLMPLKAFAYLLAYCIAFLLYVFFIHF